MSNLSIHVRDNKIETVAVFTLKWSVFPVNDETKILGANDASGHYYYFFCTDIEMIKFFSKSMFHGTKFYEKCQEISKLKSDEKIVSQIRKLVDTLIQQEKGVEEQTDDK